MLLVVALLALAQEPTPSLPDLLSRVAEEAEIFQQNATKSLTVETLEQRALMQATRFRPRFGARVACICAQKFLAKHPRTPVTRPSAIRMGKPREIGCFHRSNLLIGGSIIPLAIL